MDDLCTGGMTVAKSRTIIEDALGGSRFDGADVLVIIPDLSRSAPVGMIYRILFERLADHVRSLDCMVALGTHPPLPQELILNRLEMTGDEYSRIYSKKTRLLNHEWQNPENLVNIGTISHHDVKAISGGLLDVDVPVLLNRHVLEYDQIIIIGSVFPHEIAGFSGGNKYFFPGVSAGAINDTFHWLGALLTNRVINGRIHNPIRTLIDQAAGFIKKPVFTINTVMQNDRLHSLFCGHGADAWQKAAETASRVNIVHTGRAYRRVVCFASPKYFDFWTAAKSVYKADAIVADGGELVVVAPGIRCFSVTHAADIRKAGYHPAAWFTRYPSQYAETHGTVLSHLALARCEGSFDANGAFRHRISVTLASAIDEVSCQAVNLGYADPTSVDIEKEKSREDTRVIENAGDILYKI